MNKKGVELSMNVIVISILVILVLLVLTFFFLGGTSNLFQRIQSIGPDNLEIAVKDCYSKCSEAQLHEGSILKEKSSYCRTTSNVDSNEDGTADEKHHCWSNTIGIDCPGVRDFCLAEDIEEL